MHVEAPAETRGSNRVSESKRGFSARNEPPLVAYDVTMIWLSGVP